eukprot:s733_g12.t1
MKNRKIWMAKFVPLILAGSDKFRQTRCYKKGRPRIVQEALNGRKWSSVISGVNTVLLALATITGLFYQYSLATKRRGRKGLAFVLRQMVFIKDPKGCARAWEETSTGHARFRATTFPASRMVVHLVPRLLLRSCEEEKPDYVVQAPPNRVSVGPKSACRAASVRTFASAGF